MPLVKKSQKNVINTPVIKNPVILTPSAAITGPVIIFSRHQFSRHTRWGHGTATVQDCCSVSLCEPALTPLKATEFTSMNMDLDKVTISRWSLAEVAWGGEQVHRGQDLHVVSECDFNTMLTGWEASKPRCTCDLSSLAVNLAVELTLVHWVQQHLLIFFCFCTFPTAEQTFPPTDLTHSSRAQLHWNSPSPHASHFSPASPSHCPGCQPPPSTRPTSCPTHTDKGIWKLISL